VCSSTPSRITPYLDDLRSTLARGGAQARQLLHAEIDRIVAHQIRSETTKPLARAEVISTGKGLLQSVTFVVAGARYALSANRSLEFRVESVRRVRRSFVSSTPEL
jgi:hypothetical protein